MSDSLYRLLTELSSRRWVSRLTGRVSKSGFSRRIIRRFARHYRIKIEEAEQPLEAYRTLNEFFTRRLKPGSRPIEGSGAHVVSPVDAKITAMGMAEEGTLLQIKGQDYTVTDLLAGSPRAVNYRNGFFFVLYLSPSDYHRIHSPIDGLIVEKEHIRGRVYPVNAAGLTRMRQVLSRNERLITYLRHEYGEAAVVKVGAMNVSSIVYADPLPEQLARGDELARFEFGSTVVLLLENRRFRVRGDLTEGDTVRMGERLGEMVAPGDQTRS